MNGNRPDGNDFNFNSGGYPCAVGVNDFNLQSGGDSFEYRLVKMKNKASAPSPNIADWEALHWMELSTRQNEDHKALMQEFLAAANPKLQTATGGEVPPVPATFLEKCKWLCQYGLAFNSQATEVLIK